MFPSNLFLVNNTLHCHHSADDPSEGESTWKPYLIGPNCLQFTIYNLPGTVFLITKNFIQISYFSLVDLKIFLGTGKSGTTILSR